MALSKEDWVRAALQVTAESGIGAVAVEPLADRLGATKGSFYWHFATRDALIEEMLAAWEHKATDVAIAELSKITDPTERLRELLKVAMNDQDPVALADLALLASAHDRLVRPVLARVQAKRLDFLRRCFLDLGVTQAAARQRARLAYSAYLGWFDLLRAQAPDQRPTSRERAAYQRVVIDLITRLD